MPRLRVLRQSRLFCRASRCRSIGGERMARLVRRLLRSLLDRRLLRSLLRKLRRWLVGMAEQCCRGRRCGHVSRAVERLEAESRGARIAEAVKSVVDVGGIAGVDAMSRRDVGASIVTRREMARRGRSIVRSRVRSIRRRL